MTKKLQKSNGFCKSQNQRVPDRLDGASNRGCEANEDRHMGIGAGCHSDDGVAEPVGTPEGLSDSLLHDDKTDETMASLHDIWDLHNRRLDQIIEMMPPETVSPTMSGNWSRGTDGSISMLLSVVLCLLSSMASLLLLHRLWFDRLLFIVGAVYVIIGLLTLVGSVAGYVSFMSNDPLRAGVWQMSRYHERSRRNKGLFIGGARFSVAGISALVAMTIIVVMPSAGQSVITTNHPDWAETTSEITKTLDKL